jgi:hypothetical protein
VQAADQGLEGGRVAIQKLEGGGDAEAGLDLQPTIYT